MDEIKSNKKQSKGRGPRVQGRNKKRPERHQVQQQTDTGPIELDKFQVKAIEAVLNGNNVLVAAPTGTGKTLIAEKLAEKVMGEGKGLVYTSPLKALSNQKYADFKKMFGDEKVGLVTGDITINGDAPLTVMTTEIFRNKCFEDIEDLENTAYVVFDEIHYLDDPHRGTAWEEAILFAPDQVKILGLSATVPNVREMATWIGEVRQCEVLVVEEFKRAVPLEIQWIDPENDLLSKTQAKRQVRKLVDKQKGSIQQLRQQHDKKKRNQTNQQRRGK
ncbi:MAG: DEAD/DEAH box helicase [Firmicutes bacterium]|nr:DEAD/DEAH box helicase [Bacillota bacterium]